LTVDLLQTIFQFGWSEGVGKIFITECWWPWILWVLVPI